MADFIAPQTRYVPAEPAPPMYPAPAPSRPFSNSDFTRCSNCSAFGKGVIRSSAGLCARCQSLSTPFPPGSEKYLGEGYVSISWDHKVLKRHVSTPSDFEDDPDRFPREGSPCKIQYVARVAATGQIFDTTRSAAADGTLIGGTDDPLSFPLMREKVIRGLDLAVSTMGAGDVAAFYIHGDYAFLSPPDELPRVRKGDALIYEVELLEFGDAMPRFPTKEELDRTKKEREEEARRELKENPPLPYQSRRDLANSEKAKGNAAFKSGDYAAAKEFYDKAFVNIFIHRDEWAHLVDDVEKRKFNDVKASLHLNRCAARVKMGKFSDAEWDADRAVEYGGKTARGMYFRGVCKLEKLRGEVEKEGRGEYWDLERASALHGAAVDDLKESEECLGSLDAGVKRSRSELAKMLRVIEKAEKGYKKNQRALYKERMMGGLNEKYEKMRMGEKEPEEDDDEDLPELED